MSAGDILTKLREKNQIVGGLALSRYYADRPNEFLVCVTETMKKEQIDAFVEGLASML
jgi:glycine cleavage system pyridoxal-binding protein P